MAVSVVAVNNAAAQTAGTTTTAGTCSIAVTLPAGTAAGDRVYLVQAGTSIATPAKLAGWTRIAWPINFVVSGSAEAAGTGTRRPNVWYRDYDGVWTMPTLTLTSATNLSHAVMAITLRKALGE